MISASKTYVVPTLESYRFSPVEDTVQISFIKITSVWQNIQLNSFNWPSLSLPPSLSLSLSLEGVWECMELKAAVWMIF